MMNTKTTSWTMSVTLPSQVNTIHSNISSPSLDMSTGPLPLLKPALSTIYAKMAGKTQSMASIFVNNAIREQLLWFAKCAQDSDGIFLLKSVVWDPTIDLADATICYTDVCLNRMAYWFSESNLGYSSRCREETYFLL
jgi:hypothetical protein